MARLDPAIYADLNKQFSGRSIKNYIANVCACFGYQGLGYVLFANYLMFVYTEYLGVGSAVIASVMSVGIIIDGVTDFLMGMITDRVRTKWGKIKHWFLWMALPLALCIGLMWMVPESASQAAKGVYAFIVYNLFCTACTAVRIPAASMRSLCTDNDTVRGTIAWAGTIATTFASTVTLWVVNPFVEKFGGGVGGYRALSWIFAVITAALLILAFLFTTETKTKDDYLAGDEVFKQQHNRDKRENVLEQYGYLLRNKYWVVLMLSKLAGGISMGFNFGVMAYYMQYVIGDMGKMGLFGTVLSIPMMVGACISVLLLRFVEPRKAALVLYGLQAIAAWCAFIFGDYLVGVLIFLGIKCTCDGLIGPFDAVIMNRIIDYGEWKNGVRQDGLCNSGQAVMGKIGSAIATATLGFVLAKLGYAGAGEMPAQAVSAIGFLFLGVPAVASTLTFVIYCFMRLDAKSAKKYHDEIEERKAAFEK
jgi:GPH family glycoside/pentoside/hexuronide:cation symporter